MEPTIIQNIYKEKIIKKFKYKKVKFYFSWYPFSNLSLNLNTTNGNSEKIGVYSSSSKKSYKYKIL
jgi:hypothetical protein